MITKRVPPKTANKIVTKLLTPKHNFELGTRNNVEQVMTDNEDTELIVPVHQPNKCACMSNEGDISKLAEVKVLSKTVLEITG